jgi:undecaprenyl-diphosphatase
MTNFHAFLYGAVQGLTEYLPVSSSAHLILLPKFLGTGDPGLAFDVFLHFGTLLSTLVFFRKDWIKLIQDKKLFILITVATIPALFAGALLHHWVSTVLRGASVLAVTLPLGGLILYLVDIKTEQHRSYKNIGLRDAILIGLAQCIALVPGVSRSGATITGARLLGLDRSSAAKFSFMISAPVILAAVVWELKDWNKVFSSTANFNATSLLLGTIGSFVFGMLAIGGLLAVLRRFSFLTFAVYRVVLGAVIWVVLT